MRVELELDDTEVMALRSGGQVPLSLRDKLGDAVSILDVGWYLIEGVGGIAGARPRWWDGTNWRYGSEANATLEETLFGSATPQRLYLADEI